MNESIRAQIDELVKKNRVVLFMKGNRHFPQCGFSASVVGILDKILPNYATVNVLADPQMRDGIKEYSDWPTVPQLYVDGKFVGGADIAKEMNQTGELHRLLGVERKAVRAPRVTISENALGLLRSAAQESPQDVLRLEASERFEYDLYFGPKQSGDIRCETNAGELYVDASTAERIDGMSIDYVDGAQAGFKLDNPNEPPKVRPMSAQELKRLLDTKEPLQLIDVRTDEERTIAKIDAARPFDPAEVEALDRNAMIVFMCHHGVRSRAAAEQHVQRGFKRVFNLTGGIDAWSKTVDPNVRTY